jgi:hypothetical protein
LPPAQEVMQWSPLNAQFCLQKPPLHKKLQVALGAQFWVQ